jgi:hypothetical protein
VEALLTARGEWTRVVAAYLEERGAAPEAEVVP